MRHSRSVQWRKSPAGGRQEALGVAAPLAGLRLLRGTPRRARRSPSAAGRGRTRGRCRRGHVSAPLLRDAPVRSATCAATRRRDALHQQHGRVVGAAVGARQRDQLLAAPRQRHRLVAARGSSRRRRRCLCTPSLHSTSISPRASSVQRHVGARRSRRCRPCAPDRRASCPAAASRPGARRCRRGQQLEAALAAPREPVDAAVADPGDQPLRREHVDRRAQRHRRRAGRSRSPAAMLLRDRAVGVEHRLAHARRRRCGRPSSAACSCATSSRLAIARHRAAADAVGDDEQRPWPVERAVRVLVDAVLAAARRGHRRRRCGRTASCGPPAARRPRGARVRAARRAGLERRDQAHRSRRCVGAMSVRCATSSACRPGRPQRGAEHHRLPDLPAEARAGRMRHAVDDDAVVAVHDAPARSSRRARRCRGDGPTRLVPAVDHQRLVARAADRHRQRAGASSSAALAGGQRARSASARCRPARDARIGVSGVVGAGAAPAIGVDARRRAFEPRPQRDRTDTRSRGPSACADSTMRAPSRQLDRLRAGAAPPRRIARPRRPATRRGCRWSSRRRPPTSSRCRARSRHGGGWRRCRRRGCRSPRPCRPCSGDPAPPTAARRAAGRRRPRPRTRSAGRPAAWRAWPPRATAPTAARPALATSSSDQRPTTLTWYGARGRRRRVAAQRDQQLAVFAVVVRRRGVGVEQPGELRQVDRRRVRQPADHLAREVALDLLGLELAHELLRAARAPRRRRGSARRSRSAGSGRARRSRGAAARGRRRSARARRGSPRSAAP